MEENRKQETFSLDEIQDMVSNIVEEEKIESPGSEKLPSLDEVERIMGYKFKDRSLLKQAFTHGSYEGEIPSSYERLEYLGDAVLNLLIAKDNYLLFPDLTPGKLTRLRSANVDTEKLARAAVKHDLQKYLRHEMPLLNGQIEEFMEALQKYPLHSSGLIDSPKVLADVVESAIGAIFKDTNFSLEITWKVGERLLKPIITPETLETHPMTRFYELCQKHGIKAKFVDLWSEEGAIDIFVNDEFIGRGIYRPKKLIALNRAANNAYNQLVMNLSTQVGNIQLVRKLSFSTTMKGNKKEESFSLDDIQYMMSNIAEEKIENSTSSEKFPPLDEVERILGYEFKDRSLLQQALTHASYIDKFLGSYERIEYYGDSILNLLIARHHYLSFPNLTVGELTRLRAANVDTEKLARVAVKHDLHKYLHHKEPHLHGQIEEFIETIQEYPLHSNGLIVAPKFLADIVESLIGAIFQDTNSSLDITWKVWKRLLEPMITPETLETHPVTKLYELCQKHGLKVKLVDLWSEKGAFDVVVNDEFAGRGIYRPKKLIAINRAANNAYHQLVTKLNVESDDVHHG